MIPNDGLREELRLYFGACDVRFNKTCITITLHDSYDSFDDFNEDLELFVNRISYGINDEYTYEIVNNGRFKFYPYAEVVNVKPDPHAWVDNLDVEALKKLAAQAFEPMTFKTDNVKLEELQLEKIKQDIETFLAVNAVAALTILEKTTKNADIDMSEIEELMRFSFLNGLWANASLKDLPSLTKLFNERYNELANLFAVGT